MYLILTSTEYLATKACDISVQRTKICFQLSLCAMQNDFKMENDPSCKCQSSEPCHLEREILPVHYLVSNFRHFAIVGKTSFLSPKGKKSTLQEKCILEMLTLQKYAEYCITFSKSGRSTDQ